MDDKTKEIIAGIHNGTLATQMKMNMKFIISGIAIGAALGILVAPLFGQGRFMMALGGAVVGAGVGCISSPKVK